MSKLLNEYIWVRWQSFAGVLSIASFAFAIGAPVGITSASLSLFFL